MRALRSTSILAVLIALSACSGTGSLSPDGRLPQASVGGGGGGCVGAPTSMLASNFNGTSIPPGSTLWFTSVFKLHGANAATITMNNSIVTIDGVPYFGPNATITLSPNAQQATLNYGGTFNVLSSTSFSGNTFLNGLEVPLPSGLPGGIKNVSWSAQFFSSVPNVQVEWQWAAAAYSQFDTYGALGIKPSDDPNATIYQNSDHAGTPENFKAFVIGGARGGGGSNFTGSYSATLGVVPTLCSL